ncbi:hypothetical protein VZT92_023783 [Zoarces viviparus]|uniref:Uncharacterized protein n=1 Tax=Zoarces viviparus TaxID=48416 RepID=A0AAW1E8L9_ZOAVI
MWQQFWVSAPARICSPFPSEKPINVRGCLNGKFHGQFGSRKCLRYSVLQNGKHTEQKKKSLHTVKESHESCL